MKKIFFTLVSGLLFVSTLSAQMKIGNNATTINSNSLLELEGTSKGLLLPRVSLVSTSSFTPLTAHITGMTVYNLATSGSGTTAVLPGYYYNDGAKWVQTMNEETILKSQPWYNVATNSSATTNTQNIYQMGSIGVGTSTPQKNLHVNGSLQVTNELNIGGDSASQGSPGVSGQALISQGPNLSPVWTTLNIPDNDVSSYKLKRVYRGVLNPANRTLNSTSIQLGSLSNIVVGSADNFIYITMQSSTFISASTDSPTLAYKYDFLLNGNEVESSAISLIQRGGFSDAYRNDSYQSTLVNVATGTHSIAVNGFRVNSTGGTKTLYFNTAGVNLNTKLGSFVIFVYEK